MALWQRAFLSAARLGEECRNQSVGADQRHVRDGLRGVISDDSRLEDAPVPHVSFVVRDPVARADLSSARGLRGSGRNALSRQDWSVGDCDAASSAC